MKSAIKTAALILVYVIVAWPLLEAAVACVARRHGFADEHRLALIGGVGARQLPLCAFWTALFAPICLLFVAVLWRGARSVIPWVSAIAGAAIAPIQWKIANRFYLGGMQNCLPDPRHGIYCGLPSEYKVAFAVAGAITGLLIGLAIAMYHEPEQKFTRYVPSQWSR
jgi:hypothetical protein